MVLGGGSDVHGMCVSSVARRVVPIYTASCDVVAAVGDGVCVWICVCLLQAGGSAMEGMQYALRDKEEEIDKVLHGLL